MTLHALALGALSRWCPTQNSSADTILRNSNVVALVVLWKTQVATNASCLTLMKLQKAPFVLEYSSIIRLLVHHLKIRILLSVAYRGTLLFDTFAFLFDSFESNCVISLSLHIQPFSTIKTQVCNVTIFDLIAEDLVLLVRCLVSRLPHRIIFVLLRCI